jgi:glutathione S-transferase
MLTSRAKNVTTDVVFINLKSKPDWIATGLGGKVPVIETDDGSINESLFEADFLDETYPVQGELYPANTFLKAVDRLWVDNYNKLIPGLIFEILQGKGYANPSEVPALMKQFEDGITKYGDELTRRGTTFFGGNGKPGMMDYMLWPWMERKPVLQMYYPNSYDYTKTSARMAAWAEEMKKDEAVKTFGLAPQVHYEYVASVRAGNPNYDMLFGN